MTRKSPTKAVGENSAIVHEFRVAALFCLRDQVRFADPQAVKNARHQRARGVAIPYRNQKDRKRSSPLLFFISGFGRSFRRGRTRSRNAEHSEPLQSLQRTGQGDLVPQDRQQIFLNLEASLLLKRDERIEWFTFFTSSNLSGHALSRQPPPACAFLRASAKNRSKR